MLKRPMSRPVCKSLAFVVLLLVATSQIRAKQKTNKNNFGIRVAAHRSIISPEKELAIGKQYAAEIDTKLDLVTDPVILGYVESVVQNVARHVDLSFPLNTKVFIAPEINSFKLPGGFLYVSSGLIEATDCEGELAAASAHGTAHIAARHWAAQVTKMTLMQYAIIPLIFTPMSYPAYVGASPRFYESVSDPVYGEAAHASNWGVQVSFLKSTREEEIEADRIGLLLLYQAGYNPNAYTTFLRRLLEEELRDNRPPVPRALADHPSTSERILETAKEARRFPVRAQYVDNAAEFNAVKVRLNEMLASRKKNKEEAAPHLIRKEGGSLR